MIDVLLSFIVSLEAGIVCHLICKWLDRHNEK